MAEEQEENTPDKEAEKTPLPGRKKEPDTSSEDMIDKAHIAAERLEQANKQREDLILREEKLRVERTLGGKADAGEPQEKDETPEEYAKRVMRG